MSIDTESEDEIGLEPAAAGGLDEIAVLLVEQARADGVALTGDGGLLGGLIQRVLEGALDAELTEHLGYEPHAATGRNTGNSRNGFYPKTVRTEVGDVRIDVPRDPNGSFEPVSVPVGQRRLSGLDDMVISLYAKGLTTGDITAHLADIYSMSMDRSTVSRITDQITADMEAWQSRPLDAIYPVILIDGIRIKIRDGHVSNRTVYVRLSQELLKLMGGGPPPGGAGEASSGDLQHQLKWKGTTLMKTTDGPAVRLVDATDEALAEFVPDELAVTLGGIAEACREGLMAVAVEAGLATALAIMGEEADALCGPWNARDLERDHVRGGTTATSVVMGGQRLPIRRPRVHTLDDDGDRTGEVPLVSYGIFAQGDLLNRRFGNEVG